MIRRSTWVVLLVFGVVLALALVLDSTGQPWRGDPTATVATSAKFLAAWNAKETQQIEIVLGLDGDDLLLTKMNNHWEIAEQPDITVNQGKVAELLTSLQSLNVRNTIVDDTAASSLGLNPAQAQIGLTTQDGNIYIVQFGQLTPIQSGYYVRLNNDHPVVLSAPAVEDILNLLKPGGITG